MMEKCRFIVSHGFWWTINFKIKLKIKIWNKFCIQLLTFTMSSVFLKKQFLAVVKDSSFVNFDIFQESVFGKACFNILEDHHQKIHHGQFHWKICCSLEHLWVTASRILKWDYKWDFETERRITIPEIVTKIAYCNKAVEIFATSIQHAKNIPLFHYFFIESALLGFSSEKQMFWKCQVNS